MPVHHDHVLALRRHQQHPIPAIWSAAHLQGHVPDNYINQTLGNYSACPCGATIGHYCNGLDTVSCRFIRLGHGNYTLPEDVQFNDLCPLHHNPISPLLLQNPYVMAAPHNGPGPIPAPPLAEPVIQTEAQAIAEQGPVVDPLGRINFEYTYDANYGRRLFADVNELGGWLGDLDIVLTDAERGILEDHPGDYSLTKPKLAHIGQMLLFEQQPDVVSARRIAALWIIWGNLSSNELGRARARKILQADLNNILGLATLAVVPLIGLGTFEGQRFAYRIFERDLHVRHLGRSFFTKILHGISMASAPNDPRALILDDKVARSAAVYFRLPKGFFQRDEEGAAERYVLWNQLARHAGIGDYRLMPVANPQHLTAVEVEQRLFQWNH